MGTINGKHRSNHSKLPFENFVGGFFLLSRVTAKQNSFFVLQMKNSKRKKAVHSIASGNKESNVKA